MSKPKAFDSWTLEKQAEWEEKVREQGRERARKWKANNPEKARENARRRHANGGQKNKRYPISPEKTRNTARIRYSNNRVKLIKQSLKWAKDNPERRRAIARKWVDTHPERAASCSRRARERKEAANALRMLAAGSELKAALENKPDKQLDETARTKPEIDGA